MAEQVALPLSGNPIPDARQTRQSECTALRGKQSRQKGNALTATTELFWSHWERAVYQLLFSTSTGVQGDGGEFMRWRLRREARDRRGRSQVEVQRSADDAESSWLVGAGQARLRIRPGRAPACLWPG